MGESKKRNAALDLLKVLATVCILFHHYQQVFEVKFKWINFYDGTHFYFGYLVELFFIISGVLTYSYKDKILQGLSFKDFFLKKYLRFLPQLVVSVFCFELLLLMCYVSTGIWYGGKTVNVMGALISMLGIQAGWIFGNPGINNPLWYVSVLLLCYLIFFASVNLCNRLKWRPEILWVALVVLGTAVVITMSDLPFLNHYSGRGYYSFFMGCLLAKGLQKRSPARYIISALLFLLITAAVVFVPELVFSARITWRAFNLVCVFLYFPALLFLADNPLTDRLEGKVLRGLADISFGAYVWHSVLYMGLVMLMFKWNLYVNMDSVLVMLAFACMAYLLGALSIFLFRTLPGKFKEQKEKSGS